MTKWFRLEKLHEFASHVGCPLGEIYRDIYMFNLAKKYVDDCWLLWQLEMQRDRLLGGK